MHQDSSKRDIAGTIFSIISSPFLASLHTCFLKDLWGTLRVAKEKVVYNTEILYRAAEKSPVISGV